MSMENAILELAAAIREGAAALRASADTRVAAALNISGGVRGSTVEEAATDSIPGKKSLTGDPEIEQAVEKVEAAANEESPGRKAINAALAAAREAESKKAEPAPAPKEEQKTEQPAVTLDYKADVYPKLVGLAKAKGKPALVGLLKEFDAANGEALKPEQYAQVVARAAELAA